MSLLSRLNRVRDKDAALANPNDDSLGSLDEMADSATDDKIAAPQGEIDNDGASATLHNDYVAPLESQSANDDNRNDANRNDDNHNDNNHNDSLDDGHYFVGSSNGIMMSDGSDASYHDSDAALGGNFLAGTAASYDEGDELVSRLSDDSSSAAAYAENRETALAALSESDRILRERFEQKHLIFDDVLSAIDPRLLQNPQRKAVTEALQNALEGALAAHDMPLERHERDWMLKEFVAEVMDFGPITPYLDDPALGKILINNAQDVQVERLGQIEQTPVSFRDDDHVLMLIRRVADLVRGRIDTKVPLLDRPLPGGARVRAKMAPLSSRPSLTVEKGSGNPFEPLRRQGEQKNAPQPYAQLRERIQQKLLQNLDSRAATADPDQLRSQVEDMINDVIGEERIALTRAERAALITDLINEIIGLGPIEPLLADPDVDEVMVNGPHQIYAERKGKLELTALRFRDNKHVMQVLDRIVAPLGRRVDEKSPMVDARLRDGSRVNAVIPPLSLGGPVITIRKFARDPFTMTDLINFGSLTRESAQFLQACVEARLNILISGGTGSGKTTTLNVLSGFIPSTERIVTIEDAAELQMRQDHVVRLETRPPNVEGVGTVTIRDLVRNALRMRPDRIVIGECRGAEALDMLQAMNTGHDGSLTTGHSNAPRDMLKRLETMVLMSGFDLPIRAIREQIAMAIHIIVHQDRMKDGSRRVTYISEITGMEGDVITMQDIFRFEQEYIDDAGKIHGALQATGMRPQNDEAIQRSGVKLPPDLFQPKHLQNVTPMRGRR